MFEQQVFKQSLKTKNKAELTTTIFNRNYQQLSTSKA
jgi:hypothetical protein